MRRYAYAVYSNLYHLLFLFVSQNFSSKTLKKTRKFVIDGVEVSVTTSKIIGEDEKKDEEMRFLRYVFDSRVPDQIISQIRVQYVQYVIISFPNSH